MQNLIGRLLESKQLFTICVSYSVVVTIVFLVPAKQVPSLFDFYIHIDKLVHIFIFLVLSFLWLAYIDRVLTNTKPIVLFLALLVCLLYGIIIEVSQELFVRSRKAEALDVLADLFGASIGLFLFWNFKDRIKS
jgi:VanZ family protein